MEQNSNNTPATTEVAIPEGWTKKEMETLKSVQDNGAKPIAPTLAAQMYSLFLQGYPCSEIARLNKGFSEGDILYCRQKYKWDEQRDEYAQQLTRQMQQNLIKQKLESMEYLTNMLSVIHKEHKDIMLKFLQTGNIDDLPKIGSLKTYKDIIETLAKITGEDSVKRVKVDGKIQQDVNVTNTGGQAPIQISSELQTKLLQILAKDATLIGEKAKKPDGQT